ncbi:MAG: SIMPL domain-containing protein [Blastocatellia bacterium]|nr:SIMPL domain-containing protein [Blastocatellia bacterium]
MNTNLFKIIGLAAFLFLLAAAVYIYRPNQISYTRITVIGDSQAKISPDTAVITFSVITQGKQAVDAQQQNAQKSEAVKKAVEAVTTDAKTDIKTSDYSLNPQQDYYSGKMPKILGYEVKNTVTVSIDKLDRVGQIIDAATSAGANSVEGIQFVIGEASPAQGEALALATKQAMAKAEAVARSLNGTIVRVVQTIEGGVPPQMIDAGYGGNANAATNKMMDMKPAVRTPVQAGSLVIRSQVVLVVDISV